MVRAGAQAMSRAMKAEKEGEEEAAGDDSEEQGKDDGVLELPEDFAERPIWAQKCWVVANDQRFQK